MTFLKKGVWEKVVHSTTTLKTREIKVAGKYTLNFTQWPQKNTKEVENLLERAKNPIPRDLKKRKSQKINDPGTRENHFAITSKLCSGTTHSAPGSGPCVASVANSTECLWLSAGCGPFQIVSRNRGETDYLWKQFFTYQWSVYALSASHWLQWNRMKSLRCNRKMKTKIIIAWSAWMASTFFMLLEYFRLNKLWR